MTLASRIGVFLRSLTLEICPVKDLCDLAAKLVGVPSGVTHEVGPAVEGVGVGGVRHGGEGLLGARPTVNRLHFICDADLSLVASLTLKSAGANLYIKYEPRSARVLKASALIAAIELVAHVGVVVVKNAVSVGAVLVAGHGCLEELPAPARLGFRRKFTLLVVDMGEVENEAWGAEDGLGDGSDAFVVQVALVGVGEKAVFLGALEIGGEFLQGRYPVIIVLGTQGRNKGTTHYDHCTDCHLEAH